MTDRDSEHPEEKPKKLHRCYGICVALLIIVLLTATIRIRLLDVPLERDEGEYAYAGQLILQGIPPYSSVYSMKMPGIYAAYALIMVVFGQTHSAIHLGLLFINAATVLLMFLLAQRLFGLVVGITAAAAFALLSLGQSVQGFSANAEHFVILPALGGILLVHHAIDYQKWLSLLAGAVLLGVAYLMKQHGAAFIIFAGLYLFFCELRRRPFKWKPFVTRGVLFLSGVTLPFIVTCIVLWRLSIFEKFWFWVFDYARVYTSEIPLSMGLKILTIRATPVLGSAVFLWILGGIGLIDLLRKKRAYRCRLFAVGFLLFSFLAICPGFYFRPHYFVLLLPAVALLAGIGATAVWGFFVKDRSSLAGKAKAILLILIILLHAVYQQRNYFFVMTPRAVSCMTYGANPFPESLKIADYIKANSSNDDTIAILGSEPQICFYSDRRSATGYIYTYALMEPHPYALQMQEEMIREIEMARPKFLVFVNVFTSWLTRPDSERKIFEWFQQYQQKHYHLVGVIDVMRPGQTVFRWRDKAIGYSPQSEYWLGIYQRNS